MSIMSKTGSPASLRGSLLGGSACIFSSYATASAGASGLPESMLARAIAEGVTKFNVNTEVRAAARAATARASADGRDVLDVMGAAVDGMVPVIAEKIRAFGW